MKIVERYINATEGYGISDDIVTDIEDTIFIRQEEPEKIVGAIFRFAQKEYGRCVSKVYQDTAEGTIALGWVFQKRVQYEGSRETYLQEVWVSLYDEWRPTIITEPHKI